MSTNTPNTTQRTPDAAAGGYFIVHDKGDDRYDVVGYDQLGRMLLHTWHTGMTSMQIECEAWKSRGATEQRKSDA